MLALPLALQASATSRPLDQIIVDITRAKNLNPPRRDPTYPRVVKRARHNSYRVKKPSAVGGDPVRREDPVTRG